MRLSLSLLLISTVAIGISTCSTQSRTNRSLLAGKWQLIDMHDGQLAVGPVCITFKPDGTLIGHPRIPQSDYSVGYKVYNDSSLAFIRPDGQPTTPAMYKIKGNQLDMWLFCVENCGYRFERVQ